MVRIKKPYEHDPQELLAWTLGAPFGEARVLAFRCDGTGVVNVKKYVSSSVTMNKELTLKEFRSLLGLKKGRDDEEQPDETLEFTCESPQE